MNELDDVLAYLAVELLGWVWHEDYLPDGSIGGMGFWGPATDPKDRSSPARIDDLLRGDGMLAIIHAMRERKWKPTIYFHDSYGNYAWSVRWVQEHGWPPESSAMHEELPVAVARAAYAALREGT